MVEKVEEEVGKLLREQGLTVGTAESTTGGLISHLINSVPGSSRYYKGSVVAYLREVKVKVLKVKPSTLKRHGSVSAEACAEMAQGVRKLLNVDIALAETGIAGPTTEPGIPVGTYFIGITSGEGTEVRPYLFKGSREENNRHAAQAALSMLKVHLVRRKAC